MTRNRSFETHSGWGAAVALAAAVAGAPVWVAFLIGFAAGVVVEVIQALVPRLGSYDEKDMLYTGIGAAVGAAWVILLG